MQARRKMWLESGSRNPALEMGWFRVMSRIGLLDFMLHMYIGRDFDHKGRGGSNWDLRGRWWWSRMGGWTDEGGWSDKDVDWLDEKKVARQQRWLVRREADIREQNIEGGWPKSLANETGGQNTRNGLRARPTNQLANQWTHQPFSQPASQSTQLICLSA